MASTTRRPAGEKMSSESSRPVVGIEPSGGRKRGDVELSPGTCSKGRTATWSRMVVNHGTAPTARSRVVQPARTSASPTTYDARRTLSDIAHLLGAGGPEQLLRAGHLRRAAHHQDAELVVAEARVVARRL